jgi:integrase
MSETTSRPTTPSFKWSRAKKDDAPRGVFRQSPKTWGIRFTCALGHVHEETIGPVKTEAVTVHFRRRERARSETNWCPRVDRERQRAEARRRVTFSQYATEYLAWAVVNKRSGRKERYLVERLVREIGDRPLDAITTRDLERVRDGLIEGRTGATVNRYRDLLSAMFKRAVRLGLVPTNPVKGIPKFREAGGRLTFLGPEEEAAVRDALPERLRPAFLVALHTGLRWSEQAGLRWRDIDVLTNVITVEVSKNGRIRRVPMNAVVREVLMDLAAQRVRPDDPDERLFPLSHRQTAILFARAVERARATLWDAGRDASRLDGFTWHGLRHSFASRLVMAGVHLRTVQELGGWRTLSMVQRYAHLSPAYLHAAVERLVSAGAPTAPARPAATLAGGVGLGLDLDSLDSATVAPAKAVG